LRRVARRPGAGGSPRTRDARPPAEAAPELLLLPDAHPPHPARCEDLRQPLALISLQHDRALLVDAAAAEGALQGGQPLAELTRSETQLLDDGDLLAAAALALESHDGARRTFRGHCGLRFRTAGKLAELVLERAEGIVKGLLLVIGHRCLEKRSSPLRRQHRCLHGADTCGRNRRTPR